MTQATSKLLTHCGARTVSLEELEKVPVPEGTKTWFPIAHGEVVKTVDRSLEEAGFRTTNARYALTRNDARMFATLDLATTLASGVTLAVGVRNSTDQSFPLGFCAGVHVFVCDNTAFRSELLVKRKHTKFGRDRFVEAVAQAVQALTQFREVESRRTAWMQRDEINDITAKALMLDAFEQGIVSHRLLPRVIAEWRRPQFEEFEPRTRWSLLNAFTTVLGGRQKTNPQAFALATMKLNHLIAPVDAEAPNGQAA